MSQDRQQSYAPVCNLVWLLLRCTLGASNYVTFCHLCLATPHRTTQTYCGTSKHCCHPCSIKQDMSACQPSVMLLAHPGRCRQGESSGEDPQEGPGRLSLIDPTMTAKLAHLYSLNRVCLPHKIEACPTIKSAYTLQRCRAKRLLLPVHLFCLRYGRACKAVSRWRKSNSEQPPALQKSHHPTCQDTEAEAEPRRRQKQKQMHI